MSQVFTSPHPDLTVPGESLPERLFRHVDTHPDRPAFIDGPSGRSYTFAQVRDLAHRFAGALARDGFAKGDVLALLAPNLPEYPIVFIGTLLAGGTVTTVNPTYTADEIHHQLTDAGATRLVTIAMFLETARTGAQDTDVDRFVVIGEADDDATPLTALLAGEPIGEAVAVDPERDVAVLPYSSGTTGKPKGVQLSHRNLVANLAQSEAVLDVRDGDVALAVLPFFHIYGMNLLMNSGLDHGITTVTVPRFDMEQFLGLVQEHGVNIVFLVPPIILGLAKHPLVDSYDLSSLRIITSGAAPLGPDTAAAAAERVGCDILQGYGMTELSPLTHLSDPAHNVYGSIGPLVPGTEARIVGVDGDADLPPGEDGELWIRGPQVMLGYLGNAGATAATVTDDGWLRTGDIGHVDTDGNFWIVDRLKELIKVKGFQVAPAELEEVLLGHDGIMDAAVIGVPDSESGELPKAFVVRAPGTELTEEDILSHLAGRVARYKHPGEIAFVDEIPKSASGKILRRMLR